MKGKIVRRSCQHGSCLRFNGAYHMACTTGAFGVREQRAQRAKHSSGGKETNRKSGLIPLTPKSAKYQN